MHSGTGGGGRRREKLGVRKKQAVNLVVPALHNLALTSQVTTSLVLTHHPHGNIELHTTAAAEALS